MPSRRFVREWWPEMAVGGFVCFLGACGIFARARSGPVADIILAVGYSLFMMALGWWMGFRHHRLTLHDKVERIGSVLGEIRAAQNRAAADRGRPRLRLIRPNTGDSA